jgi:hypothetical protein
MAEDALTFRDRYSTSVRSSNLRSAPDTTHSATDVLGAAGIASKRTPLGIALMRLFSGDNGAAAQIVQTMAGMLVGKAWHAHKLELKPTQATDMAQAVLAWHRDGTCKPCGGHGYLMVEGAPTLSDHQCPRCRGTGRVPFDRHFKGARLDLAQWLVAEVEREQAFAGPAAMRALAPRLEL